MILTKKIKSFTLAEMLVVLVISAIVVSLAIAVLMLVQKQMQIIQSIEEKKQEIIFLERALSQDFNQGRPYYQLKEKTLTKYSKHDTVSYKFNDGYVLRNDDTLKVDIKNIQCFLDGHQIKEGYVDAIGVSFSEKFYNKDLFISKIKDAAFYMN